MTQKRKIVLVKWIDSMQTGGWRHKEAARSNMNCMSCGFLVERTRDYIILALNMSAYTDGDYIQIPMVAVKSVKTLHTVEQPEDK